MYHSRALILCCLIFVAGFLAGCNQVELVSRLSEHEFVEASAILAEAGIKTKHERTGTDREPLYSLSVNSDDAGRAFQVLRAFGMPRAEQPDEAGPLEAGIFSPVSAELMQRRIELSRARELERLISAMPAVAEAHVAVRMGTDDDQLLRPGAQVTDDVSTTVTVSVQLAEFKDSAETVNVEANRDQIVQLASRMVPGAKPEGVMVTITRVLVPQKTEVEMAALSPFRFSVRSEESNNALREISIVVGIFSAIACALGLAIGYGFAANKSQPQTASRRVNRPRPLTAGAPVRSNKNAA
jgi:type III secretory pathway lipoprotein EscJ